MHRRKQNTTLRYGCIGGMAFLLLGCMLVSSLLSTLLLFVEPVGFCLSFTLAAPPKATTLQ